MRERGLKSGLRCDNGMANYVAPHAGAWIEISIWFDIRLYIASLLTRERGLKYDPRAVSDRPGGRFSRGSVDGWKFEIDGHEQLANRALFAQSVG